MESSAWAPAWPPVVVERWKNRWQGSAICGVFFLTVRNSLGSMTWPLWCHAAWLRLPWLTLNGSKAKTLFERRSCVQWVLRSLEFALSPLSWNPIGPIDDKRRNHWDALTVTRHCNTVTVTYSNTFGANSMLQNEAWIRKTGGPKAWQTEPTSFGLSALDFSIWYSFHYDRLAGPAKLVRIRFET